MFYTRFYRHLTLLALLTALLLPCSSFAKPKKQPEPPAQPPLVTKTITSPLKPERPKRTIDLYYLDSNQRSCTDTYRVEASKVYLHANQPITFTTYTQRKCGEKFLNSPIPKSVSFTARNINGKTGSGNQTLTPSSGTFSFTHTFPKSGTYQINITYHIDDIESHTISFTVSVLP